MRTLQVVNFREYATFIISDTSIKVTVEEMRCVQSTAYINSLAFHEYHLRDSDEQVAFRVNLTHVVTCLKVHSKSGASLKLSYRGHGFPLELIIEENGVVTDCNLKTFPPDNLVDFSMDPDAHNRVTMTSDLMKTFIKEIDPTSEVVEIGLSSDSPNMSIVTAGHGGQGLLEMDKTDGTFRTIECPLVLKSSYKLCHLRMAFKPLSLFQTLCLRIDREGLLRLQYMTNTPNMSHCVAEFYVLPLCE